jgi:hypothetical protein
VIDRRFHVLGCRIPALFTSVDRKLRAVISHIIKRLFPKLAPEKGDALSYPSIFYLNSMGAVKAEMTRSADFQENF